MTGRPSSTAAVVLVIALLAGCRAGTGRSDALDSLDALAPSTAVPTTTVEWPSDPACEEHGETASFRPSAVAADDASGFVADLRERGRIHVGVDQNTVGFSNWDPGSGDIEGFEVDIAHAIARRVFRDDYTPDVVDLVPVDTDEKVEFVRDDRVDLTISAISMSCRRWTQVAFSSEYYTAHQRFLVRTDSTIDDVRDLAGKVVCVTKSSSSIGILDRHVPDAEQLAVPGRTDCLVALEEGDADAYLGHDSFLYGMLSQDGTVEIAPEILPQDVTVSHYGIAIAHQHRDFVRFVNGVLDELADGTWAELHDSWLEQQLGIPHAEPPTPDYRD